MPANLGITGDVWQRKDKIMKALASGAPLPPETFLPSFLNHSRYCQSCRAADKTRVITFKPPARKSSRKRANRDYASLHAGLEAGPNKWLTIMEGKTILDDNFQRLKGSMLTMDWLHSNDSALREPVIIENPEGLGMTMPPEGFGVKDVAEVVGENLPVEVIGEFASILLFSQV